MENSDSTGSKIGGTLLLLLFATMFTWIGMTKCLALSQLVDHWWRARSFVPVAAMVRTAAAPVDARNTAAESEGVKFVYQFRALDGAQFAD